MSISFAILYKSFIKSFYKENAGTFVFIFTMLFFVVGTVDGAGLLHYHYGLIKSILTVKELLLLVFAFWFFYARKCAVFISQSLRSPAFQFFYVVKAVTKYTQFFIFLFVDLCLLLPVLLYSVFIITVGISLHAIFHTCIVILFLLIMCISLPLLHIQQLNNPEGSNIFKIRWPFNNIVTGITYPAIILRAVLYNYKMVWMGIKVFTCGLLFLLVVNNTMNESDIKLSFIFFSFGILANGVLVSGIRLFEEMHLSFYRGMPVPLHKRFLQYLFISFILLIPECITMVMVTPSHLHYNTALSFLCYAFCTVLLLFSISFLRHIVLKQFVKLLLLIFFAGYFLMMAMGIFSIAIAFLLIAIIAFFWGYYRFSKI